MWQAVIRAGVDNKVTGPSTGNYRLNLSTDFMGRLHLISTVKTFMDLIGEIFRTIGSLYGVDVVIIINSKMEAT